MSTRIARSGWCSLRCNMSKDKETDNECSLRTTARVGDYDKRATYQALDLVYRQSHRVIYSVQRASEWVESSKAMMDYWNYWILFAIRNTNICIVPFSKTTSSSSSTEWLFELKGLWIKFDFNLNLSSRSVVPGKRVKRGPTDQKTKAHYGNLLINEIFTQCVGELSAAGGDSGADDERKSKERILSNLINQNSSRLFHNSLPRSFVPSPSASTCVLHQPSINCFIIMPMILPNLKIFLRINIIWCDRRFTY